MCAFFAHVQNFSDCSVCAYYLLTDKIVDQIKLSYFTCINSEYKYKIGYYLEYSDSEAKILQFVNGKIQTIMGFNAVNKSWYPIIE